MRPIAAIAAIFVLTACGNGNGESVQRQAFRASFLHSCLAAVPGKAGTAYCRCTEDRLEASFTDQELSSVTPDDPKFREATHACAAKAGLRVAPGH